MMARLSVQFSADTVRFSDDIALGGTLLRDADFAGSLPDLYQMERRRQRQQFPRPYHRVAIAVAFQDFSGKGLSVSLEVKSVAARWHVRL
jgi:hypothetical protein